MVVLSSTSPPKGGPEGVQRGSRGALANPRTPPAVGHSLRSAVSRRFGCQNRPWPRRRQEKGVDVTRPSCGRDTCTRGPESTIPRSLESTHHAGA
eukprot:4329282-Pyramimonas_sp.AAC.1